MNNTGTFILESPFLKFGELFIDSSNQNTFKNLKINDLLALNLNDFKFIFEKRLFRFNNLDFNNHIFLNKKLRFLEYNYIDFGYYFVASDWNYNFNFKEVIDYFRNITENKADIFVYPTSDDFLANSDPEGVYDRISNYITLNIKVNLKFFKEKTFKELIEYINGFVTANFEELKKLKTKKYEVIYKINKILRTGIKQYLIYFNNYVKNTKNIDIDFEVENHKEGLLLKVGYNQDIELINKYFIEYTGFLKLENIEDVEPVYEIEKNKYDLIAEKNELRNELHHLKYKYENAQYRINVQEEIIKDLKENLEWFKNITEKNLLLPSPITINNTNNINNNLNNNIEQLQQDIYQIKSLLSNIDDLELQNELKEIKDKLFSINKVEELKTNKTSLNLFKVVLNTINNKESILNQTIKASDNGKEIIKKIMPLVPSILSNINKLQDFFN